MEFAPLEDALLRCPVVAYLRAADATLLRGVSTAAREAVALGCSSWGERHLDDDRGRDVNVGLWRRCWLWHRCFPHARVLRAGNFKLAYFKWTNQSWASDAMSPPQSFPCLASLSLSNLRPCDTKALARAVAFGALPRLERVLVREIETARAAFVLGRSLAGRRTLRSVIFDAGFDKDFTASAFLDGLSTTQSVTQLALYNASTLDLVAFSPRLPYLSALSLFYCGGDQQTYMRGEDDAFEAAACLEDLSLLAPCSALTHLAFDHSSCPMADAIRALPHLPSLTHACAIDYYDRSTNQIVADTRILLKRAPRLQQLVVQRHVLFNPSTVAGELGTKGQTLCEVAVRRQSACGDGFSYESASQWAYAVLPLEEAIVPVQNYQVKLDFTEWGDETLQVIRRLASMACMQGPPPHEASRS